MYIKSQILFRKRFHLILGGLLYLLISPLSWAAPLVSIGDNIDIIFNGNSQISYVSNLFLGTDKNAKDDWILHYSPGFEVIVGEGEAFHFFWGKQYRKYREYSRLDSHYDQWQINTSIGNAKVNCDFLLREYEAEQSTGDIRQDGLFVRRKIREIASHLAYIGTAKTRFLSGIELYQRDFQQPAYLDMFYRDNESLSIPFTVLYSYSPKFAVGMGYRYRKSSIESPLSPFRDSRDHFLNLALDGEISPKVTVDMRFGWQQRRYLGSGAAKGRSMLAIISQINYNATTKTKIAVQVNRDFTMGSEGYAILQSGLHLNVLYAYSQALNVNFNAGNEALKYTSGRKDRAWSFSVSSSWIYSEHTSFSAGFGYVGNNSNLPIDYKKFQLNAGLSYQY